MADGVRAIAELPDPVGEVIAEWDRPNGLHIERVRTPLGVIGVIYESRPNVTADAGALCLKAGNAVILRGGSDSLHSSHAIHACLVEGLKAAGLPADAIQIVPVTDRAAVGEMLTGLVRQSRRHRAARRQEPRRPRAERGARAGLRPSRRHLPRLCRQLGGSRHGGGDRRQRQDAPHRHLRRGRDAADRPARSRTHSQADPRRRWRRPAAKSAPTRPCSRLYPAAKPATEEDWATEYLDAIISVKLVDGVAGAIEHIETWSSHHTEAIIAEDAAAVARFFNEIDSAILLHNASTQFADGGEFGFGGEIGIATGKMHARGPVGVEQLTSFKYRVRGTGQARP